MPEQHIASVVNDYRAASSWAARCSCGWEELHSVAAAADRSAENHMRQVGVPWENERDRLEAEVNRWHAEAVHERMKSTRLIMKVEAYRAALQQIAWLADATEPLSVKAAEVAREALENER